MANSTISLATALDTICAKNVPDPREGPSGYGDNLALDLATQVMADLIAERFNWKWNSANAAPVYTNSWQQDYPQPAQASGLIGWGESCDIVDINSTAMPKPLWPLTWRKQISRTSVSRWRPGEICWMYNSDLTLGTWPGAHQTYSPLVTTTPQPANPIMNFQDANGNILIVTGFGTTGTTAPKAASGAAEGTTVTDGTVTWTVVSGSSQGFRINTLPSATGPTWQLLPVVQIEPPIFTTMNQLLNPIPNSYSRVFYRGLESECLIASPNPGDQSKGQQAKVAWLNALIAGIKQGNRESDTFRLIPERGVVDDRWIGMGARTADSPF